METMATKHQVLNGIILFMDNHMIPEAKGNYKIILRGAKALMAVKFDNIFESLKNNALVSMAGLIDEDDNVDITSAARILHDAFGNDEFSYTFNLLGEKYSLHLSADDIGTIKNYIERS
jgi:hypothetical protein